jgi:hypothetical protein
MRTPWFNPSFVGAGYQPALATIVGRLKEDAGDQARRDPAVTAADTRMMVAGGRGGLCFHP